jgi:hypothetical protein
MAGHMHGANPPNPPTETPLTSRNEEAGKAGKEYTPSLVANMSVASAGPCLFTSARANEPTEGGKDGTADRSANNERRRANDPPMPVGFWTRLFVKNAAVAALSACRLATRTACAAYLPTIDELVLLADDEINCRVHPPSRCAAGRGR